MVSEKDWSLRVLRKVNFIVSLTNYRISFLQPLVTINLKINFQKMALFVFSKCIVLGACHVWGHGFHSFVLIVIGK